MEELKLKTIISTLNQSSVESVQTGNGFNEIDKYLHTERPISEELIDKMLEIDKAGGGIILLVGSAGDGKSHLLSKVKDLDPNNWPASAFYNDATASSSPNKTAIQTLKEGLQDFSDASLATTNNRKILAINLGKLNAFIDDPEIRTQYGKIANAVAPLFEGDDEKPNETDRIKVVEFSNKQIFEFDITKDCFNALDSSFISTILRKITKDSSTNPFYKAYKRDISESQDNFKDPIIINFQLLQISEVRRTICLLVIEAIIRFNLSITPREFLDFIYSIIIPKDYQKYKESTSFFAALLPTLLFNGGSNPILGAISKLDPLKYSSTGHDEDLSLLFTSNSIPEGFLPSLNSKASIPTYLINKTNKFYDNNGRNIEQTTQFIFRLKHLLGYHSECETYCAYIDSLRTMFSQDVNGYEKIYSLVSVAIPRHYGSYVAKPDSIPLNIQGGKYKLFSNLQMEPEIPSARYDISKPYEFKLGYRLKWTIPNHDDMVLDIDYPLFQYLFELSKGKLAVSYENEKNIKFGTFVRQLASFSDAAKKLTVFNAEGTDITMRKVLNRIQIQ